MYKILLEKKLYKNLNILNYKNLINKKKLNLDKNIFFQN